MQNNKIKIETPAFVCSHIFNNTRPILFVSREDGDWQFLCGGVDHMGEKPKVVGSNHLFERDPTLMQLVDLPDEWVAERTGVDAPWIKIPPDGV